MNIIKVVTKYREDLISQEIQMGPPQRGYTGPNIMERVLHLQEEGVRTALIKLGWTPPPDNLVWCNQCKGLVDNKHFIPALGCCEVCEERYREDIP